MRVIISNASENILTAEQILNLFGKHQLYQEEKLRDLSFKFPILNIFTNFEHISHLVLVFLLLFFRR